MKPITRIFVVLVAYMAQSIQATPSAADIAAADALCSSNFGAGYTAVFDANDDPTGCDPPVKKRKCHSQRNDFTQNANIMTACFYGPYTDPLTGAAGCCGVPGKTFMSDPATKTGACCSSGERYRWDAGQKKGFCEPIPPPIPPVPAVSCPASNLADKQAGGVTFRTFCDRAVQRLVPLIMAPQEWARLRNSPPTPSIPNAELCMQACAANPKCQGANWLINQKACALNTYGPSPFLGNYYKLPPVPAPADVPIIAFQSIPKRPGT